MVHLCLDTCTWIYLANGIEPTKLIKFLESEINSENIRLVVPEIIIEEWNRNKEKAVINHAEKIFKDSIESLGNLKQLIDNKGEGDVFLSLLGEDADEEADRKERELISELVDVLGKKKEFLLAKASENIKSIDSIFSGKRVIKISTSEESIKSASKMALEKVPPFGKKNSMADALIFLDYVRYLQENKIEGAYFISWNSDDFCFNKKHLHENLDLLFQSVKGNFKNSLSHAIHNIKSDIITLLDLKHVEHNRELLEHDYEQYYCIPCNEYRDQMSPIFFEDGTEIFDERMYPKPDPNQLEIFDDEDILSDLHSNKFLPNRIKMANCDNCCAEHILCPECGEVIEMPETDFNEINTCPGCDLRYNFVIQKGRKGDIETSHFLVLDDFMNCERCGETFQSRGDNSNLCEKCEEHYAYKT